MFEESYSFHSKLLKWGLFLMLSLQMVQVSSGLVYDEEYDDDHVALYKHELPSSYFNRHLQNVTISDPTLDDGSLSIQSVGDKEIDRDVVVVETVSDAIERAKNIIFEDEVMQNEITDAPTIAPTELPITSSPTVIRDSEGDLVEGTGVEDGGSEINMDTTENINIEEIQEETKSDNENESNGNIKKKNSAKAGNTLTDVAQQHTKNAQGVTSAAGSNKNMNNLFTIGTLFCSVFFLARRQI